MVAPQTDINGKAMQQLDLDNALLIVNPEASLIELLWQRPFSSQDYRCVYQTALDKACEFLIRNWFIDIRKRGLPAYEDEDWWYTTFLAWMKELAPKGNQVAVLLLEEDYNQLICRYNLFWSKIDPEFLSINYFTSEEDAKDWLNDFIKK
ncbi:MAG: hypothetical protein LPK19_08415 [Hymenobacteraceae bacterium]|nr:hypothetical protein [Hymenobacteraceae bacterium]MDX5396238.1 hypothetical protein [Hymenobacteraceae bacterium]MDX5512301.1 hypothetical protein [Hymenobacteraceae bacterium]